MSKPARLYPKPEPLSIDTNVLLLGCSLSGIIFFILGYTFQNVVMVV